MPDTYTTPRGEARLMRKQVERVKHIARYVVFVDEEGNYLAGEENNPHGINVFAVVGPVYNKGIFIEEALLCEVGRKKGKPYNAALQCSARRHYLKNIPPYAVKRVWKILRGMIERDAAYELSGWNDPRYIERYGRSFPRGIVYSVSLSDQEFLASVLQTELYRRSTPLSFTEDMKRAARWLDKKLAPYDNLEFAPEDELVKEIDKKNSDIGAVSQYLYRRTFLPHQMFLLRECMNQQVNAKGMFFRLVEREGIDWNEVDNWGKLLFWENVDVFDNAYVFCRSTRFLSKRSCYKKRAQRFQGYLPFFLTPQSIMDRYNEDPLLLQGETFPPVIPGSDLPDHDVPF